VAKAIDRYISEKRAQVTEKTAVVDARIERVVQLMFSRCFRDSEYQQAIGIALESFRLDIVKETLGKLTATQVCKGVFMQG
jgi:26S proteasome regulatory subunit N2